MAPSDKKFEAELLGAVREVFKTDKDQLTVNHIRKRVESDLGLEDGFFSSGKWKEKSKQLIKELAVIDHIPGKRVSWHQILLRLTWLASD